MSGTDGEAGPDRWRALAGRVVRRVGGLAAVRVLLSTLAVYDLAGGGLVAGGLAYASLLALLPGLLLVFSIIGMLVGDPATLEQVMAFIAVAVPPLEDLARAALEQVAAGAVPTGVVAFIALLWGSSRFYGALDYAFSKAFHNAPRRNEIERTLRGVLVTGIFIVLPIAAIVAGAVGTWVADRTPNGIELGVVAGLLPRLVSPLGSFVLFVGAMAAVYRWVPAVHVPARALLPPALVSGFVLAVFTQIFGFIAPRMSAVAALYGAILTVFVLLAWLSISFNVLLLGASWTRVRQLAMSQPMLPDAEPRETAPDAGPIGADPAASERDRMLPGDGVEG